MDCSGLEQELGVGVFRVEVERQDFGACRNLKHAECVDSVESLERLELI